ncbi:Histone acetyltransferase MCC1-like protein [Drosera capensis]
MSFTCVRRLYGFYLISGQQYDSYLFVYYINGGRSPCSPLEGGKNHSGWSTHESPYSYSTSAWELVMLMFTYLRSAAKTVTARLWRNEEKKAWKSSKCKDGRCLMPLMQSKGNPTSENTDYQCV